MYILHSFRESCINGCFSFTGKQVQTFCEQLQKLSYKKKLNRNTFYKQPGLHDLPHQRSSCDTSSVSSSSCRESITDTLSLESGFQAYSLSLSRSTSLDSFKDSYQTKQQTSSSSLRKCVSLNKLKESDESSEDEGYAIPSLFLDSLEDSCQIKQQTSLSSLRKCASLNKLKESDESSEDEDYVIPSLFFDSPKDSCQIKRQTSLSSLRKCASLNKLKESDESIEDEDYVIPSLFLDSPKDSCQIKQQTSLSSLRKCASLDKLKELDESSKDEEYVVPSLLPLSTSRSSDYLTILPDFNCYEEIINLDDHYENKCMWLDSDYCTIR